MVQQSELTAQDIRETMQSVSQEHLQLETSGYVCTSEMLYDVIMKAASENISINAVRRSGIPARHSGFSSSALLCVHLRLLFLSPCEDA